MLRIVVIWIIEAISVLILDRLMPGFNVNDVRGAILFVGILGLLNALVRPFLIRLTLPLTLLTFGLFSLVINALLIVVAIEILPGVEVNNLGNAIIISIGLAGLNAMFSALLAIDDTDSYYRNVVKKFAKKHTVSKSKGHGVIFLEIDGLSYPAILRAIQNGYMPNLARWLRETHQIVGWETDLASSTPSCQSGILNGNNSEIPAFRWFDRSSQKVMTMGNPKDAALVESKLLKKKNGLLSKDGMSINNMFSGGAKYSLLTLSNIMKKGVKGHNPLYIFFVDPYNFTRTVALFVVDVFQEIKDAYYQKRQGVEPRIHRGGTYPLMRAVTTIAMRDASIYTIIGDIFAGVPSIYATFVGYDEVAHHAGIERSQAMFILQGLDKQFAKIEKALESSPRPYHLVVLSDHGQSQGATFLQRYNETLEDFVAKNVSGGTKVKAENQPAESWDRVNVMANQLANEDNKSAQKLLRKSLKSKTKDGVVVLTPTEQNKKSKETAKKNGLKSAVVLASGNLGLIYFTGYKNRLVASQINKLHPNLLNKLVNHDGISFVMVADDKGKPKIFSNKTLNNLDAFGKNTLKHLKRTNSFTNAPDILVNSMFDPGTLEIAAFEELVGAHGGIGGAQNNPFLLYPKNLDKRRLTGLVGAESIHKVLKKWVTE